MPSQDWNSKGIFEAGVTFPFKIHEQILTPSKSLRPSRKLSYPAKAITALTALTPAVYGSRSDRTKGGG